MHADSGAAAPADSLAVAGFAEALGAARFEEAWAFVDSAMDMVLVSASAATVMVTDIPTTITATTGIRIIRRPMLAMAALTLAGDIIRMVARPSSVSARTVLQTTAGGIGLDADCARPAKLTTSDWSAYQPDRSPGS